MVKVPKANDLPEGHKMTELGLLPQEWQVLRLRDAVVPTKQVNPASRPTRVIRYVDVSSVDRGSLRITGYEEYTGSDAPSRARKEVRVGDVIFATVRPSLRRVALVPQALDGEICSTAFCVARANPSVAEPSFLFFTASHDDFVERVSQYQRGASYPAVTDRDVLAQWIPLPPLHEQRKIAAVLGTVQEAKEKTEAVIGAAKELKKSLMKHLFTYGPVPIDQADKVPLKETEIGPVPRDWEVSTLGAEGDFQYGYTASATEVDTGTKFLRITDIRDDRRVNWNSVPYATVGSEDGRRFGISAGNILFARIGATTGKTCIIGQECPKAVFASYLIRLRVGNRLDSRYAFYYTNTAQYQSLVEAGREGKLKKGLNSQQLKSFPIPVPPLPVQTGISEMLSAVDKKLDALEDRRTALDQLFRRFLKHLMTARIRVNNLSVPTEVLRVGKRP